MMARRITPLMARAPRVPFRNLKIAQMTSVMKEISISTA